MTDSVADLVRLRGVEADDIPTLHRFQLSPEANWMAAFTAEGWEDLDVFTSFWTRLLANDAIGKRAILYRDELAGSILQFEQFEKPSLSYWLGQEFWGKGVMTRALQLYLEQTADRPLYARVAKDNVGSLRVLEKCGFRIIGEDVGFAHARESDVEEFILELPETV